MPATISPRHCARTLGSHRVSILRPYSLALLGLVALAGCGGGGGSTPVVIPPNAPGILTGTVTDANSAPIVGATVRFGSQSTTSTQNGSYRISNVVVPTAQTSLVGNVVATTSVKGIPYSGQNQAEVLVSDAITHDVQIVMSPTSAQGSILGVVTDTSGHRVAGARVFANVGPFSQTATPTQQFFGNLGSFNTTTRSDGGFTLPALPPSNLYTVVASLAGKINQTVSNINVLASSSTTVNLTLTNATGTSTIAAPVGLAAQSITTPANPTRAAGTAGTDAGFMNVIRRIILQKRGLLAHHSAAAPQITLHRSITRSAPSGSLIETDMFWDYIPQDNVFGYTLLRSPLAPGNFNSIATVRDPLADRFADSDPDLTPDTLYYYSIATLDTINFPVNGTEGPPNLQPVSVKPLNALSLVSPASGSVAPTTPTFTWNAVNRATHYKVLVYPEFPTLQSDTDPNGVAPIWSADFSTTTATYAGPALVAGHTYYWAVLGQDDVASAFSVSPLQTFRTP